jgi:hypothetical protein
MLMVALGAEKVYCVDRFRLLALGAKNVAVVRRLQEALPVAARRRLDECFIEPGMPTSGFRPDRIEYIVRPGGLSGLRDRIDLVISRAVLEHVDDLPALFVDMVAAMRDGALAAHLVDLRSHGLHRRNPLVFLTPPSRLWKRLYSHKGVPNRWRVDTYRSILATLPVSLVKLETTMRAEPRDVIDVRPGLAKEFRDLSDDDLSCLGFWLVFRKAHD